jgi:hypothetical protein
MRLYRHHGVNLDQGAVMKLPARDDRACRAMGLEESCVSSICLVPQLDVGNIDSASDNIGSVCAYNLTNRRDVTECEHHLVSDGHAGRIGRPGSNAELPRNVERVAVQNCLSVVAAGARRLGAANLSDHF